MCMLNHMQYILYRTWHAIKHAVPNFAAVFTEQHSTCLVHINQCMMKYNFCFIQLAHSIDEFHIHTYNSTGHCMGEPKRAPHKSLIPGNHCTYCVCVWLCM